MSALRLFIPSFAALLMACSPDAVTLQDDNTLLLPPEVVSPFGTSAADINSPYAEGARFEFSIAAFGGASPDVVLSSDNQGVLEIGTSERVGDAFVFPAVAAAEGQCELLVTTDAGDELLRVPVEVLRPEDFEVEAVLGVDGAPAERTAIRTLGGGIEMLYRLTWTAEGEKLHGAGQLGIGEASGLDVLTGMETLFGRRDTITVSGDGVTDQSLEVRWNDHSIGTLQVGVVAEDAVSRVTLFDEHGEEDGDSGTVYAQAFAADGAPIDGVPVEFEFEGNAVDGVGNTFSYEVDLSAQNDLVGAVGGTRDSLRIPASAAGTVGSTPSMSCSVVGFGSTGALAVWLAVGSLLARGRARKGA